MFDPYNREYTRGTVHINNEESYVMVIHNPQPRGVWKIVASAAGPYSLRVTGVSRLDFGVKFATVPTTSYENANWQPVQGITTHALIEPSGMDGINGGIMQSVSLLDIRGVELGEYSLSKKGENLYVAEPFRPPDVREYYLIIKGQTGAGQTYIRQSHNAIINIVPEPPRIKMVHTQPGYLNTKGTEMINSLSHDLTTLFRLMSKTL